MEYFGIIDKLKPEHKQGIYGRKDWGEEYKDAKEVNASYMNLFSALGPMITVINPLVGGSIYGGLTLINYLKKNPINWFNSTPVGYRASINSDVYSIIFDNNLMGDDYNIKKQPDLFYGLFDNLILPNKSFETIMKSHGGSKLVLIEREKAYNLFEHFGSNEGKLSLGLYCSHPKDIKKLIPLEDYANIIKTLILEETIRAYEALGAKEIIIDDLLKVETDAKESSSKFKAEGKVTFTKDILRKKQFGTGVFQPERATKNNLLIHDFPNIMSVIQGRIEGNQLSEEFTEDINLSTGVSVDVLNLFKTNIGFNFQRKWHFKVTFYDKNEMNINKENTY